MVNIDEKDIRSQEDYQNTAFIGYMLGDTSYKRSTDNYVTISFHKPRISIRQGYYIFQFHSIVDWDLVMQAGLYTGHNKPFIFKIWEINFYIEP